MGNWKFAGFLLLAVLFYVGYGLWVLGLSMQNGEFDFSNFGAFADSFGVLTSLFSGLAFVGVLYTISMEKKSLGVQRQELELTRKEMQGQRKEAEIQNELMRVQKFEITFFNLLSAHNELVNNLICEGKNGTHQGRAAFKFVNDEMKRSAVFSGEREEDLRLAYDKFRGGVVYQVEYYFRSFQNVLAFVDDSSVENKTFYADIVRAHLSNFEMVLIFYYCFGEEGSVRLKGLVEKYCTFYRIPEPMLIAVTHKSLFDSGAFVRM